ncbi:uncharacterized protein LOC144325164 [Podarcis muralis]
MMSCLLQRATLPGMRLQLMMGERTSRRFPADNLRTSSPLPLLRTGMAPSRPCLKQKQQPKFTPIKAASQFISEREETLVSASVLGWSGRSPDARKEEDRLGQLIRSGREPFPNIYFVLVKSLERCDDPQVLGQREQRGPSIVFGPSEAHSYMMSCLLQRATLPGMRLQLMMGERTSRWFLAGNPHISSPLPLLRTGMAPSRPCLKQKQQPKFPPIKTASQFISEREKTLAAASVPGRPGWSPDARREEDRLGQLIRSGKWKCPFPGPPPPSAPDWASVAGSQEPADVSIFFAGREPFPNIYFVLVRSLERCDDPQVLGQREQRGPSIVFGPSEAHSHMMSCFLHRATPPGMRLQRLLPG